MRLLDSGHPVNLVKTLLSSVVFLSGHAAGNGVRSVSEPTVHSTSSAAFPEGSRTRVQFTLRRLAERRTLPSRFRHGSERTPWFASRRRPAAGWRDELRKGMKGSGQRIEGRGIPWTRLRPGDTVGYAVACGWPFTFSYTSAFTSSCSGSCKTSES